MRTCFALSQRVVRLQTSGDRFARELVEVPVRDAAVHELREANDVATVPQVAREEVLHINAANREQRTIFEQREEQRPQERQSIKQGRQSLSLAGFLADLGASFEILGRLVDLEIAIKKSFGRIQAFEQTPVTLPQFLASHLLGNEIAVRVVLV